MWAETIASASRRGGAAGRAFAGRLLTGPWAFLAAGLIDLLAALWLLKIRRGAKRLF